MKTLMDFAKAAGFRIVECGPGWGGRIGYTEEKYPDSTTCGFRTERAALNHWAEDAYGKKGLRALKRLIALAAKAEGKPA